ncbi:Protein apterous [Strongyloides ratti]|uniref:Protein apterous n=1 Tax=Strongyloides ratti TaxID=34506 RepID=A0A090KUA6_STRRB|nr:Protein apterous [Strongyloides ratti]CEF61001.1 Protein apterous [Strongyloides ratti]
MINETESIGEACEKIVGEGNSQILSLGSILMLDENIGLDEFISTEKCSPKENCHECSLPIDDKYYLIMDNHCFHMQCLKCSVCFCNLAGIDTCFTRDGLIYCRKDYMSKYFKQCDRCNKTIVFDDLIMKVNDDTYFHATCFSCIVCFRYLQPGECFKYVGSGQLFCQIHCYQQKIENCVIPQLLDSIVGNNMQASPTEFLPITHPFTERSINRNLEEQSFDDGDSGSIDGGCKSKRMRTSFKHHQLRTMKAYFNLNHNPDSKDLKALAQKTGLTKRVLQVWFQNARAKHRRTNASINDSFFHATIASRSSTPSSLSTINSNDVSGIIKETLCTSNSSFSTTSSINSRNNSKSPSIIPTVELKNC